ncbi:24822_t:CDS:2 [Gigaspora rosea]|nr:24822_t:CDS:2 [Gigaspora rosea]
MRSDEVKDFYIIEQFLNKKFQIRSVKNLDPSGRFLGVTFFQL